MPRRLRTILRYLVLGAMLNVAVAWGVVLAHGYVTIDMDMRRNPRSDEDAMLLRRRLFGHELFMSFGEFPDAWKHELPQLPVATRSPWWPRGVLNREGQHDFPEAIAAGWPCLALRTWSKTGLGEEYAWGLVWDPQILGYQRALQSWDPFVPLIFPFQPIWPGFALNTAFYAVLLWRVVGTPRALRGIVRRRRGLCPRCAYPREDHAVCLECGRPHRRRMDPVAEAHAAPPA